MKLKNYIRLLYFWFLKDTNILMGRNIDADKNYIEKLYRENKLLLKRSNHYFLRSFLQYKCQMHKLSFVKRIALNIISPFLMIAFILYTLLCNCFFKTQDFHKNLAVINGNINDDLIPESLQRQYQLVKCKDNYKFILDLHVLIWLIRIISRYLFHPYFIFKLIVKISQYSYLINCYHPKVIIATSEYSFCSSVLTGFCEEQEIKHFNVMHGEKSFNIRDSFFKFSHCYIWEDYYVDLFQTLKADINQFIVERPPKQLKIISLGDSSKPPENIIKFYWGSEYNKDELIFISQHLKRIKEMGFNIIVRFHPLHKNVFYKKVYPFLKTFKIEDPASVTLYTSLLETEYVFGTYTTVLYEGYLMNRKLIINDFNYLSLLELNCISIHLSHSRLSEFKG